MTNRLTIAPDGSIVVVDYSDKDINDGDLAVFCREGEAAFKRYHTDSDGMWLEPDSTMPRHQKIFPDLERPIGIIGRVVKIRHEY